jgi:5-methylcytosine-specific restriction endonuclease McrA
VNDRQRRSRVRRLAERDGDLCWLCRGEFGEGRLLRTVDHVVPASAGGSDALENLRLAHKVCNSLRGSDEGARALDAHLGRRSRLASHPAIAALARMAGR